MSDLGMVSTFPATVIIALVLLLISFGLNLRRLRVHEVVLFLHVLLLICMLFGIQNIVEEAPRFSVVYRHAGYTEYITRTGTVNPNLDAYFSWPGFFVLSAFLTQITGYHSILAYAGWAPVFYNIIYIGPLYMIFTSLTANKRLIWLGLWIFFLTQWVGQDYFSPQGLNFFLYLVVIAILLKWFKPQKPSRWGSYFIRLCAISTLTRTLCDWMTAPSAVQTTVTARRRCALLIILLVVFAFCVFSHPLTPFFVLASVIPLALFNRSTPRWLPFLLAAMTAAWIIFMTRAFLAGHSDMVVGGLGQVGGSVTTSVTSRVQGNAAHAFITALRIVMSALLWLLALAGGIRRFRHGYYDTNCVLLAISPFPIIAAQNYGGEMFLRIYLFALPFMAFLAAAFFYGSGHASFRRPSWRLVLAITLSTLVLLGGFFFTRYGNERMDYVTFKEVAGIQYLYEHAQSNALFLAGWNDTPWMFQGFEKYTTYSMADVLPDAVAAPNADAVVQFIKSQPHSQAFVVLTIAQEAQAESFAGFPPGTLDRLGAVLTRSGKFAMVYHNSDIQVYLYVGK